MTQSPPVVLQLCHDYKPPFLSVARQYVSLFRDSGYRVITVFLKGAPSREVEEALGPGEVVFLDNRSLRGLKLKPIEQVKRLHRQYGFKLCIAQRYKALYIASHLPDVLTVGVIHIDGVFDRFFRRRYVTRRSERLLLLGVSRAIRDDIRQSLPRFPRERVLHLYNSLDFDAIRRAQLDRQAARRQLGLPEDAFLFGSVGRLHPDKDQKTLIDAFADVAGALPEARLVIAGEGRLREALEAQVRDRGLVDRVLLLGAVPEVYRYLPAFDAFVLSSIREGLPVALLEAFAAGLPCIVSRCTGNEEAIEGVGFSFAIGDRAGLSALMREVYHLPAAERRALGERVREKVDREFSEAAVRRAFWSLPQLRERGIVNRNGPGDS